MSSETLTIYYKLLGPHVVQSDYVQWKNVIKHVLQSPPNPMKTSPYDIHDL